MQKTAFRHLQEGTGMREVLIGIGWFLTRLLRCLSSTSFWNNPSWAVNVSVIPICLFLSFARKRSPPAVTCIRADGAAAWLLQEKLHQYLRWHAIFIPPARTSSARTSTGLQRKVLQLRLDCQHQGRVRIPAGDIQRCILHVKDEPLKEIRRVFVWLWFLKNAERYLRWSLFAFKGSKLMYFSGLEGSHFLSGRRSRSHSVFFPPRQYLCVSVWYILNLWLGQ